MGTMCVFKYFHKEGIILVNVPRITLLLWLKIPGSSTVRDAIEAEKYIFLQYFQLCEKPADNTCLSDAQ